MNRSQKILNLVTTSDKYLLDLPKYESTKGRTKTGKVKIVKHYK